MRCAHVEVVVSFLFDQNERDLPMKSTVNFLYTFRIGTHIHLEREWHEKSQGDRRKEREREGGRERSKKKRAK